ncbi:hexosaminidase D-like [Amphibalanus amphitrite]|uniref:hexosaminidase D-like n=1 Tax=Amphibalanus amphitrite TaxID=1232801 RepID=UPI001C914713|nr:hexosaminidase D-like [Amphibalanus amphitrite]
MSITTCIQHLPGMLWRWRTAVVTVALLCLLLQLMVLQTSPDTVRHGRRPAWVDPSPAMGDERSPRAAALRQPGRAALPDPPGPGAAPAAVGPDPAMVPAQRIIHLDLKGAPPTVDYLVSLLPMMRRLGATGLLIEWEDMFPFWGPLRAAAARNHYSRADVRRLLSEARRHDLDVIPLVQTFGHLEPFLKLRQFAHLRELPAQPAALCPSRNESLRLVEQIVDQVMKMHAGAPLLHIGCDEVYHMGLCELCQRRLRDDLYLEHVATVARYVRDRHGAKALIWDDMMRHIPAETLRRSGIGELVEPMVWVYAEDVDRFADPQIYSTFAEVFPRAWAASAYKGAFGETLTVPPLQRHLDNTLNWLRVIRRETPRFRDGFGGLVLTGWQRYDHMAVLCELLPASVPSLALNLATASHGFFNSSLRRVLYDALSCHSQGTFITPSSDQYGFYAFSQCDFPGHMFYEFTGRMPGIEMQARSAIEDVRKKGWLTEYSVARNYTNPFRVDEVLEPLYSADYHLSRAAIDVRDALSGVMDRFTVAEWVEQKLYPWMRRIEALRREGEAVKKRSEWPARPLPMLRALARFGLDVTEDQTKDGTADSPDGTQLNDNGLSDTVRLSKREVGPAIQSNRDENVDNAERPELGDAGEKHEVDGVAVHQSDRSNTADVDGSKRRNEVEANMTKELKEEVVDKQAVLGEDAVQPGELGSAVDRQHDQSPQQASAVLAA